MLMIVSYNWNEFYPVTDTCVFKCNYMYFKSYSFIRGSVFRFFFNSALSNHDNCTVLFVHIGIKDFPIGDTYFYIELNND